jgi:hypothetical protein
MPSEEVKGMKHINAFLKIVQQRKAVEVVLPTTRVLCRNENGVYFIQDSESTEFPALRGIWVHIENYPGRNRGMNCFLYFHFPHYVKVDPELERLDERLLLRGKYLHYNLQPAELADPSALKQHLARFEKIILTAMYLYTREKEEEKDESN